MYQKVVRTAVLIPKSWLKPGLSPSSSVSTWTVQLLRLCLLCMRHNVFQSLCSLTWQPQVFRCCWSVHSKWTLVAASMTHTDKFPARASFQFSGGVSFFLTMSRKWRKKISKKMLRCEKNVDKNKTQSFINSFTDNSKLMCNYLRWAVLRLLTWPPAWWYQVFLVLFLFDVCYPNV